MVYSVTAFSVWAQDTPLDTLVVTANRFQEPLSTVLAPVTIVTREDIDRWQVSSVNDVLRRLHGVAISQHGEKGSSQQFLFVGQTLTTLWY